MGDNVVITYETLFELYRREKLRGEIQELDKNFFKDVTEYLSNIKGIVEKSSSSDNIFAGDEKLKAEKQLLNVKKILNLLYELRVKKITDMAWIKARDPSFFIDDGFLLKEEKAIYNNLVSVFIKNRKNTLIQLFEFKQPIYEKFEEPKELKNMVLEPKLGPEIIDLKILEDTDEFVDEDMNMLGPFVKGDVAKLPKKIAEILLDKNLAEPIKPQS